MISPSIRKFLGIQEDAPRDYLFITMEESKVDEAGVYGWIQDNYVRGCLAHYNAGSVILQVNNGGRKILTNVLLDAAIDTHGATLSGKVCIAVEVNTSVLSASVPVGYSPNGQVYDEEGEVLRQKTVEELMVTVTGTEGKSLILCSEKTNGGNGTGLQMEELLRFRNQFPLYYVFSDEQLAAWKSNNIVEGA